MSATPGAASNVGFIGLGKMGLPMATCLLAGGHSVMAHDSRAKATETLRGKPRLSVAADAATLAAARDIIVLMLPTSAVIRHVMQEGGLLAALRPGTLVIDMGSSVPAETRSLAAEIAARGGQLVDAPVSGSVAKALTGTLAIMAGGDDAAIDRAMPVLSCMGEKVIRTGPVGSAHAMKALNNFVYAAGLLASIEAVRMGERLGLDLAVLTDVMNASSGRNVATETKLKQHILNGGYSAGFQIGLQRKDLETAGAIAAETGFDARSLALCRHIWTEAVEALGPAADNTELHRHLR
ncbi:NAD(P)-dependent oxidoreductase [Pseudoroseomonas globiformis]|uniref:NAD(P)-dependent oxidoreductase n=1 Tax=Teichococcus globiformis TaxID=2307229 RepID=A0ABV7G2I3_9PROT